jgi:hypothetical protein
MPVRFVLAVVLAASACSVAAAADRCDTGAAASFEHYYRVVNSLRPDKPGQTIVYAADGSRFSPAEAHWLKGQIRAAERTCGLGNTAEALQRLQGVRTLIDSRRTP